MLPVCGQRHVAERSPFQRWGNGDLGRSSPRIFHGQDIGGKMCLSHEVAGIQMAGQPSPGRSVGCPRACASYVPTPGPALARMLPSRMAAALAPRLLSTSQGDMHSGVFLRSSSCWFSRMLILCLACAGGLGWWLLKGGAPSDPPPLSCAPFPCSQLAGVSGVGFCCPAWVSECRSAPWQQSVQWGWPSLPRASPRSPAT